MYCPLQPGSLAPDVQRIEPRGTDQPVSGEAVDLRHPPSLTILPMRTVFYLLLALLVLRTFFPELGRELEQTLLAFLGFATDALANPPV